MVGTEVLGRCRNFVDRLNVRVPAVTAFAASDSLLQLLLHNDGTGTGSLEWRNAAGVKDM